MDTELWGQDENSHEFAKDVGKTFVLSAVAIIGTMGGMLAVGYIASGVQSLRERRAKKKADKKASETE